MAKTRITLELAGKGPWGITCKGGDGKPLLVDKVGDQLKDKLKEGDELIQIGDDDVVKKKLKADQGAELINGSKKDIKITYLREGPPPEGAVQVK